MKGWRAVAAEAMVGLGAILAAGTGCGNGVAACHDDWPPAGAQFVEGGASCTLPGGRAGVGMGDYGCVDPTVCHCKPEAGSATCAAGAVCVYAACSGANEGAACTFAGGARGTCCRGACSAVDLLVDPSDCGGCGNVCPVGVTCNGACAIPAGATPVCPSGLAAAPATCVNSSCVACVAASCAGLLDGAPCAVEVDAGRADQLAGLCCHGACVLWYGDDQNCGGCGVTCCPGTHCQRAGDFSIAAICF